MRSFRIYFFSVKAISLRQHWKDGIVLGQPARQSLPFIIFVNSEHLMSAILLA